jgi:threonine aldolase
MVAKAAFWAALEQKPKSRLVLRRKAHVIEDELGAIAQEHHAQR